MAVPATTLFPWLVFLSGGSIVGGDDNDTLNFSAGVNNNAIVAGDGGSDLLYVLQHRLHLPMSYGGAGGDSMVFKGACH